MNGKMVKRVVVRTVLLGGLAFFAVMVVAQIISHYQSPVSIPRYVAYSAAALFVLLCAISYSFYRPAVHVAASIVQDIKILIPLAAVMALAVLSVSLARPGMSNIEVFSAPGIVFVVAMAALTVFGFLLTVSKLHDIHSRIRDYGVLMDRCTDMLKAEIKRVTDEHKPGKLLVFANAPGFGSMSAPDEWLRYSDELGNLIVLPKVRVVLGCLSWIQEGTEESTHDKFYKLHWPTRPDLQTRIDESKRIATTIVELSGGNRQGKAAYALVNEIQEVPFHLIMTSERAIMFVSLSYPSPNNDSSTTDEDQGQSVPFPVPAAIVAIETNDGAMRRALEDGVMARLKSEKYAKRVLPSESTPATAST